MNTMPIKLPDGCQIWNGLFEEMDIEDKHQDVLTVKLPNNIYLDVGWYPDWDP
jgi:hypothetical protein